MEHLTILGSPIADVELTKLGAHHSRLRTIRVVNREESMKAGLIKIL